MNFFNLIQYLSGSLALENIVKRFTTPKTKEEIIKTAVSITITIAGIPPKGMKSEIFPKFKRAVRAEKLNLVPIWVKENQGKKKLAVKRKEKTVKIILSARVTAGRHPNSKTRYNTG